MSDTIHVYMAMDLETKRVLMQTEEFSEGSFPRGQRGAGWPVRQGDAPREAWERILNGKMPDEENDRLHRAIWNASGETPWPNL